MAIDSPYREVIVESYMPNPGSGLPRRLHIRPVAGGPFPTHLRVECSRRLITEFPEGTKFLLLAKLTDREGYGRYLYSNHRKPFEVIE